MKTLTYQELYDAALDLGKGILLKNYAFQESVHNYKFVGIYAKNRYEWLITDWACILWGICSVPLYDTLGVENLTYCLKQTEMTTLFVSGENVKTLLKLSDVGNLQHLVLLDDIDQETQLELHNRNMTFIHFKDLIKEGSLRKDMNNSHVNTQPNDCLTFSYTSGTTGPPKGAMISHRNILAFTRSLDQHSGIAFKPDDVYPSYLPLPHLMERCIAISLFYFGAAIMYNFIYSDAQVETF